MLLERTMHKRPATCAFRWKAHKHQGSNVAPGRAVYTDMGLMNAALSNTVLCYRFLGVVTFGTVRQNICFSLQGETDLHLTLAGLAGAVSATFCCGHSFAPV